jgi:hypothetical protein
VVTSVAVLRGLAANEALDLTVLGPLLASAEPLVLEALAARSDLTPAAAEALARGELNPAVALTLARNPAAAVHVWGVLVAGPEPEVRRRLAHDGGRLPVAAQRALSADPDAGVRRVLALQRGLAPEVARRLAGDGVAAVRRALTAYGWSLPGDTVRALLLDPDDEVRAGAVRVGPPPPDLVPGLLTDPVTRVGAAEHAALPADLVAALIGDADSAVREAVVRNAGVPTAAVLSLAGDPDEDVRAELMVRPDLADDLRAAIEATVEPQTYHLASWLLTERASLARRLAHVRSPFVFCRRAVAFSADLPEWAVMLLAADRDHSVRLLLAEHHPGIPGWMLPELVDGPGHARSELVRHPAMPPEALAAFAASADEGLRWVAATGPNLPAPVAAELASHPDRATRIHVAANPALPLPALIRLLDDTDAEVARAAARNPALPRDWAERLIGGR